MEFKLVKLMGFSVVWISKENKDNKEFTSRIFIVFLPFCNYITSVEIKGITGMYILIWWNWKLNMQ